MFPPVPPSVCLKAAWGAPLATARIPANYTPTFTPEYPVIPTMSSVELVDFINANRAPEEATLRHDHFMVKVTKVLGERDAPNFRGIYTDSLGRGKPCYRFPKREACLMAMSYSYDIQAKVYDRMTDLERGRPAAPAAVRK